MVPDDVVVLILPVAGDDPGKHPQEQGVAFPILRATLPGVDPLRTTREDPVR
jgi:hypothetical protein